jgi:hypothetical protein
LDFGGYRILTFARAIGARWIEYRRSRSAFFAVMLIAQQLEKVAGSQRKDAVEENLSQ